jgi:hypothetical protein
VAYGHFSESAGKEHNLYYWYYASRVMQGIGGQQWTAWRDTVRKLLVDEQVKRPGSCDYGSWDVGSDMWGKHGGRVMMTSLATIVLQLQ